MATQLKSNFRVDNKYGAFYTGGKVQLSNDGCHIFCQNGDKVEILEVETGRVLRTVGKDAEDDVTCFVLSPDDQILVIAGRSLLLRQYDWKEDSVTRTWKAIHFAPVSCMSFDVTTTLLATGSADSTIKVWDIVKQYCTHNLRGHSGVISVAEFHPDISKLQLFSAGDDYKIRAWDLQTSVCTHILDSHYSVITALVFAQDNMALYSGGRDNIISVWSLEDYKKQKTIPVYESLEGMVLVPSNGDHTDLGVKTQDPHVITAGAKGELKVWNIQTSQCVHTFEMAKSEGDKEESAESSMTGLTYNKTLDTVTVVTYDHNIIMYNVKDLSLYKQFVGYQDEILDIKFLGSNESHIAVATNSPILKVYNVESWDCQILHGHTDTVLSLDVSADKQSFVSASKDNSILVWQQDKATGQVKCVAQGKGHTNTVQSVAFSRLSNEFVVSGSQDLTLKLWPLPSDLSRDTVTSLHAKVTEKVHDKDINSIMVAPNDKVIATGSQDKTAKLWQASDLTLLGVFRGHRRGIWCVQFSPVDQCLATSSADGSIKIWSLTDFSCVKTFEGHDASVLKINFMTRGMQLLSTGSDGLLKLWTIKSSECVKTFDEHQDKVWALACSKQEDKLITGAGDSQIIIWKDVTVEEQEEIRAKQEDFILKDQELNNLVHQKKYLKAIGLAINLDQPFRVLSIIKEIINDAVDTNDLEKTILKLKDYQLDAVLRYASTWNTNSKHCHAAHHVLSIVLQTYSPEQLYKLPNFRSSMEGLIPYTERHCQRLKRLEQQSTFVDYTWQCMRLVAGDSLSIEETPSQMAYSSIITNEKSSKSAIQQSHESSSEGDSSSDELEITQNLKRTPKNVSMKKSSNLNIDSSSSEDVSSDDDSKDSKSRSVKKRTSKTSLTKPAESGSSDESDSNDLVMSLSMKTKKKKTRENVVKKVETGNLSEGKQLIQLDTGDSAFSDNSEIGKDSDNSEQEMEISEIVRKKTSSKKKGPVKRRTRSGSLSMSDSGDCDLTSKYGNGDYLGESEEGLKAPYTMFKLTGSKSASKKKKKQLVASPVGLLKKQKLSTPKTDPVHRTKQTQLKSAKLKKGRKSLM